MDNIEVKQESEILQPSYDMVDLVFEMLKKAGLVKQAQEFFLTNEWIVQAKGQSFENQRFLLNRFWNMQLISFPNTANLRYYLIKDGEPSDWLVPFYKCIIPFCIENDLPRQI